MFQWSVAREFLVLLKCLYNSLLRRYYLVAGITFFLNWHTEELGGDAMEVSSDPRFGCNDHVIPSTKFKSACDCCSTILAYLWAWNGVTSQAIYRLMIAKRRVPQIVPIGGKVYQPAGEPGTSSHDFHMSKVVAVREAPCCNSAAAAEWEHTGEV